MQIQTVSDYLTLVGKRARITHIQSESTVESTGLVRDLSDTGRHLMVLQDGVAGQKIAIALNSIQIVELVDARPSESKTGSESSHCKTPKRKGAQSKRLDPKLHYFPKTDCLYVRLSTKESRKSCKIVEGIVFDYDGTGRLVGIDISEASQKLNLAELEFTPVSNQSK